MTSLALLSCRCACAALGMAFGSSKKWQAWVLHMTGRIMLSSACCQTAGCCAEVALCTLPRQLAGVKTSLLGQHSLMWCIQALRRPQFLSRSL